MIPVEILFPEIERADLTAVRIFDRMQNKIYDRECNSSEELIQVLKDITPLFKNYGICEVWCATEQGTKANFRGAFKWKVSFADKKEIQQQLQQPQQSTYGQMKELIECMMLMQTMSGANKNSNLDKELIDAKIALMESKYNIELEKYRIEKNDPVNQWGWAMPLGLSMMGKNPAEIKDMMSMMAYSRMPVHGTPGTINPVAEVKNSISDFEDLKKLPNEEKNKMVTQLEEKLYDKVPVEGFIILLQLIIENPERVQKAIAAAKQGLI